MKSLADLQKLREEAQKRVNMRNVGDEEFRVVVGMATCGIAAGARPVLAEINRLVVEKKLPVVVTQTGCIGLCQYEPIVEVYDKTGAKTTYIHMNKDKAREMVESHLVNKEILKTYTVDER